MKRSQKTAIIVASCVVAVAIITGAIFLIVNLTKSKNSGSYSSLDVKLSKNNNVAFHENVHVIEDSSGIQKEVKEVSSKNSEYTITYSKKLPEAFDGVKVGDVFCVYPDRSSKKSFFSLGFCGKLTEIDDKTIKFTAPSLTEVFSDLHIDTSNPDNTTIVSTEFLPTEDVVMLDSVGFQDETSSFMVQDLSLNSSMPFDTEKTKSGNSVEFEYKKPKSQSLLKDYILLGENINLKFKSKLNCIEDCPVNVKGEVSLVDPAIKLFVDYKYDKEKQTVDIKDYSVGFLANQKASLTFSANKKFSLEDLKAELYDKKQIIEIEDVTDSEKGKIVLGTYLIGLEAALPQTENEVNKVNYLSLGIAIQLAIEASGEISFEINLEESGFIHVEANGNGEDIVTVKGYDYPNPATETRKPNSEEENSIPEITYGMKGSASLNVAVCGDVGICILGIIPIKQETKLAELDVKKNYTLEGKDDKYVDIIKDNFIINDEIEYLTLSSSSSLKVHLGAKIFDKKLGSFGAETQIFKTIHQSIPSPVGFSHAECTFGGVTLGEKYTQDELNAAMKKYLKTVDKDSFKDALKNKLFSSVVNKGINALSNELFELSDYLDEDIDNYNITYNAAGIVYVRDTNDILVAMFITGENVANKTGLHTGLAPKKIEHLYGVPEEYNSVDMAIGSMLNTLFNIGSGEDSNFANAVYKSSDSEDKLELLFYNDALKLIILTK